MNVLYNCGERFLADNAIIYPFIEILHIIHILWRLIYEKRIYAGSA